MQIHYFIVAFLLIRENEWNTQINGSLNLMMLLVQFKDLR